MVWTIFENWWKKSEEDKQIIVKNCLQRGIIIDENNSGMLCSEIEELAAKTGLPFVKVWNTFTDVAGMRDQAPGVMAEGVAFEIGTTVRKN